MPFIDRAGHAIHYEVRGDASLPPLLLVMGLALSSRAWDALPERLSTHYRVITFDNRGTGRSGRRGLAFVMRDLADDAAAVLRAVGVPERAGGAGGAFVFGISMGGMIAQHLALRHPGLVRKLALGATHAGWLRSRKPTLSTLGDLLRSLTGRGRARADVLGRYLVSAEWHAQNPHSALDWIKRAERTTLRFAFAQMAAVARHTAEKRLREIAVPTLVLTGDADKLVPHQNSQRLVELIPGAKLVVLRGAGHAFPLERAEEVVRELTQFFA
jgi:pimeloyl-ACP methyl ester carboxylesterase